MAAGLHGAGASIAKFGKTVGRLGAGIGRAFKTASKYILGAGAAVVGLMMRAEQLNKQLAQIAAISQVSIGAAKKEVKALSAEFGLAKDELTKGLYDALSAGVPKENVFDFMRTAAKAAVTGAGTTAESVDMLTTTLNAFGKSSTEAGHAADVMFTTIRLGKTTLPELAQSFADVAPVAAASGVSFEDVAAALATMTAQGTKTPQAVTQLRAAIIAMNKNLGDGWSKTMSLSEGMAEMSRMAGGSATKLHEMTGRIRGAMGIMQMTGKNAARAAKDVDEVTKAAGAMGAAFKEADAQNVLGKVWQSIDNMARSAGDAALKALAPLLRAVAKAAKNAGIAITKWMDSEKFKAIETSIRGIVAAMGSSEGRGELLKATGDVLKAAWAVAVENSISILKAAAPIVGQLIAKGLKATLSRYSEAELVQAQKDLGFSTLNVGGWGELTFRQRKQFAEQVVEQAASNRLKRKDVVFTKEQITARGQLTAALEKFGAVTKKHAPSEYPPIPDFEPLNYFPKGGGERVEAVKSYEAELDAAAKVFDANLKKETAALAKQAAEKAKIEQDMADKKAEYIAEEKRLKAEAFSDEIGQKKKLLEKAEEVAKMSIDAIIQGAKDKKKADKEAEDVAAKAARLLKEEARMAQPMGGRLGRKDRDFLDAWRKQQAAIGQAGKLRGELQVAEDNLAALTNNGKTLVQLLAEWKLMAVDLNKNLQMG